MDRTLVILRHAKAERPGGVSDFDRPLTERGHADAAAAGRWLVSSGYRPDLVLCSPARRTRQTWHGVALALDRAPHVRYERELYESGSAQLLALLRSLVPEPATVLLVGHNPTVSLLSQQLGGGLRDGSGDPDGLRTCGVAVHRVAAEWADLRAGAAPLVATHTARAE